jgi:peptidoglycan/LPS O-acetylase OafA/YrhL
VGGRFHLLRGEWILHSLEFQAAPGVRRFFSTSILPNIPSVFFAVLLFALVIPWTRAGYTPLHKLFQIGTHLALVHNFHDQTFASINTNFWSIAVEVQLYLLYPLLLVLVSRWGWEKCLAWLAVLEFGLRGLIGLSPSLPGVSTFGWWQGLPANP